MLRVPRLDSKGVRPQGLSTPVPALAQAAWGTPGVRVSCHCSGRGAQQEKAGRRQSQQKTETTSGLVVARSVSSATQEHTAVCVSVPQTAAESQPDPYGWRHLRRGSPWRRSALRRRSPAQSGDPASAPTPWPSPRRLWRPLGSAAAFPDFYFYLKCIHLRGREEGREGATPPPLIGALTG